MCELDATREVGAADSDAVTAGDMLCVWEDGGAECTAVDVTALAVAAALSLAVEEGSSAV